MKKVISLFLSVMILFSVTMGHTITAQAEEQISTIEVNSVQAPSIGATIGDLCFFSVPDWAEYRAYSSDFTKCMLWFDLDSDTPDIALPMDTVCLEGHQYAVSIRLVAVGASFASSHNAYVNGKEADTSTYLGRNASSSLAVNYTFPKLTKEHIDNLDITFDFGTFAKDVTLTGNSTLANGNMVSTTATSWSHDGTTVQGETTVTYGNWGFFIGMTATDNYYFDESSTITVDGRKLTPTAVYSNGKVAFFRSADDFFSISCTHNYSPGWSSDGTIHWKPCSICGDKSEQDAHTFGAGVTVDDVTTYTCSVCGYQKVDKYIENGFRYADVDGGVQVVTYKGSDINVNVPSALGGKKVVSIADYAFATADNKTSIKSVTLPSTVTSVGKNAFNGCTALTSVNLPSGVTRIEEGTFLGCEQLGDVAIPYGVTFIGADAFNGCGISSVIIPCSVNTIKSQAFRGCNNLGSVVVPDSVTTLETGAFISCANLKSVVIGERVNKIPDSVFDSSNALETLTLPAGLTSIGKYNLDNKSNFTKIYFRGTQTQWDAVEIGSYNTNLATIEYNYTTKMDVGQHKYQKLTAVEPTCVDEGYELNVCEGCGDSFKTNVTAPTGVHNYNSGMVTQEATCKETGKKLYTCNVCGASYTETIAATNIHNVDTTKYESDESNHWNKCSDCSEKQNVSAHIAGDWIVDKEATETAVGSKHKECSVCGYKVETAEIPKTGKQEETTPVPAAKGKVITDKQGSRYKVTKSDAKNGEVTFAKLKSSVKGTVKIPDTVTIDGITYKVTAIEANAFKNNKNITKVIIGNNVTVIGKNAFAGCKKLSSVTVGKNVKTISAGAFSGCAKLKTVKLGAAVTTIGDRAFYKCTSLAKITIPAKVKKIGKQAFYGCKKLKSITIKTTKLTNKNVGSKAFKGIYANATIKVSKRKYTSYKKILRAKGVSSKTKIK